MITIAHIKSEVEKYFHLNPGDIDIKSRKTEIVEARQITMYLSKKLLNPKLSLTAIGKQIGNKDHATVLHSNKTVIRVMTVDRNYRSNIEAIENNLKTFTEVTKSEIESDIMKALMNRFSQVLAEKKYFEASCCD